MTMGRREVLDLLAANGLRPSRALGQNFVADGNTVRRIARLAGVGPGDHVVEIGAGLGALTLARAETGASVTAVEVDRHLVPVLESVVAGRGVSVLHADARQLDWPAALAGADRWALVANLPYNVATPLVLELLERVPAIDRMLVMVQREVGDRLAAGVGDDAYGAVSVKVGYWATASVVGKVPPTVFVPQPRVESALVTIERRLAPAVDVPYDRFEALVRAGFATRRKMLRRALAGTVAPGVLEAAGVDPAARAEELDVEAWGRLTACAMSAGPPPS
jgi:16S rRNA (adenine1518-N6/adenine1519-N6)-dimethyltransferase